MSTVDQAINLVEAKGLPFWKLYKGSVRLSQCDTEENPDASAAEALQQFKNEVAIRPSGNYRVLAYRKSNGEKGGFNYEFTISETQPIRSMGGNNMSMQDIMEMARREILITQALERIEKKVDALGEFIFSQNDDDDSNDGDAIKKLGSFFGMMNQIKGMAAGAGGAAGSAAKAAGTNGFANMKI